MAVIKEKYEVLKGFHDKENILKSEPWGRHYAPGSLYPSVNLEVADERVAFLIEEGFIKGLEEEEEEE